MKIVHCEWEIVNLDKKTIEITIESKDKFDVNSLTDLYSGFEYVVIKVPMMMIDFNDGLSSLGFTLMENQMNVSKEIVSFDYSVIKSIYSDVDFKKENSVEVLDSVLKRLTSKMFLTDRITLDKHFGPFVGMKRYQNWIKTEVIHRTSELNVISYKGIDVGFMLFKIENGVFKLLLNGLYEEWQGKHLGVITPASPLIYAQRYNHYINKIVTNISSNNIPCVKLYNRLGFTLDSQTYVFIKHIY